MEAGMYSDKVHKNRILPIIAVAAVLAVFLWRFLSAAGKEDLREEGAVAIQAAVEQCALQCYVVEGFYPPSLAYLEAHYGLQLNKEDYYVAYNIFASNIPPDVKVLNKPTAEKGQRK